MKKISEQIFYRGRNVAKYTETDMFTWGEVKEMLKKEDVELQDNDILEIGYNEGFHEEDNSQDAHYFVEVTRFRDKTEKELEQERRYIEESKERNRKSRYETYLKYKEEFEPKNDKQ